MASTSERHVERKHRIYRKYRKHRKKQNYFSKEKTEITLPYKNPNSAKDDHKRIAHKTYSERLKRHLC